MSWGTSSEMRCRGSTPGSFERPSRRALSRQIAHGGGGASSARSAQPRARQPKMVTQQRIQALSSQRPAGSRGGNPHRDMGRRPGRRPVGGPPPGRLPYARAQKPARDPTAPPSAHPKPCGTRPPRPGPGAARESAKRGRVQRPPGARGTVRPTPAHPHPPTRPVPQGPPNPDLRPRGRTTARGRAPGSRTSGRAAHHEGHRVVTRPPAAGVRRQRCSTGTKSRSTTPV